MESFQALSNAFHDLGKTLELAHQLGQRKRWSEAVSMLRQAGEMLTPNGPIRKAIEARADRFEILANSHKV